MTALQDRIRQMLPLYSTERAFQYIYENKINLHQIRPTEKVFRDIFSAKEEGPFSYLDEFTEFVNYMKNHEALNEDIFFPLQKQISVLLQPRYMPTVMHSHKGFFELQYIINGTALEQFGDFSFELQQGDICFIAPGTSHQIDLNKEEILVANILIKTEILQSAFGYALSDDDVISDYLSRIIYEKKYDQVMICRSGLDQQCMQLILDMFDTYVTQDVYSEKILSSMIQLLFLFLLKNHKNHFMFAQPLGRKNKNFFHIIQYIQKYYHNLTLEKLADQFNYTSTYMSLLIRENYGMTFQEIIKKLKLQEASKKLAKTNEPISGIIASLGYTENSYFYRLFKQMYGMTPNEYRNSKRDLPMKNPKNYSE